MNAREIIAANMSAHSGTPDYIAGHAVEALRERPEAVRSLLSDELLADIRACAKNDGVMRGWAPGDRVLAWLDGEQ